MQSKQFENLAVYAPKTQLRGWQRVGRGLTAVLIATLVAGCLFSASSDGTGEPAGDNILLVILDDVGVDQLALMGYGGAMPPRTPTIDAIGKAGLRFRNTWSMPECSPGRAAMFVGRYPMRTQINQAIGANDLANSHVTPYDLTAPKLLRQAGYESAMFGKFHLAGPENNADANGTPRALGWDYFYGWVGGLPASIDTTAGGVAPQGTYSCGFVPSAAAGGADQGACRFADGACTAMNLLTSPGDAPGKQCLARGGIFVPAQSCSQPPPAGLNFNHQNAYYVSPLVINTPQGVQAAALSDARSRGYRTTIETDAAIRWIRGRTTSRPWMATVSYSAAHTPAQQPPSALLAASAGSDDLDCKAAGAQRQLTNQMIEALDTELGRLLVETGLASRNGDGTLNYDPQATRTTIVIVGDNGSVASTVKLPFDPERAKSTSYQTGVWVPLIVAGPQVANPNRNVENMVNTVDLFSLFGELAGLDVRSRTPRRIDSEPMLPYLRQAGAAPVRTHNFTQGGYNLQAFGKNNGPCVLGDSPGYCSQTPMSKSICEDNGGVWWGAGATDASVPPERRAEGYTTCCQTIQAIYKQSGGAKLVVQLPGSNMALRNEHYKLVRTRDVLYTPATDSCEDRTIDELYEINQALPTPKIDRLDENLMLQPLSDVLRSVYNDLSARLVSLLSTQKDCPGDGNRDGVVDEQDYANAWDLASHWGGSSIYDINLDGRTDDTDLRLLADRYGSCPP